jgi:hypothetical protein
MHALLLSLTFGGQGLGLPDFGFPWRERRFEAPDLRVVLMSAQVTAEAPTGAPVNPQQASIEPPATDGPTLQPPISRSVNPAPVQVAAEVQAALSVKDPPPQASIEQTVADEPTIKPPLALSKIPALAIAPTPAQTAEAVSPKIARADPAAPAARNEPAAVTDAVAAIAPPPITAPAVIAVERSETPTFAVPPPPSAPTAPTPAITVAPSASSLESALPTPPVEAAKQEAAKQEAMKLEATRTETARLETQRQEEARLAAAKAEAQRQTDKLEAARVETVKVEANRQEDARVDSARLAAAKLEAQRQADKLAAARVEAAKVETATVEAARQEAARIESARLEAARLEAQRQEAARLAATKLEAQRQDVARQEAERVGSARVESARLEALRLESARLAAAQREAQRQEAVRQAAAGLEVARVLAEKEEDAKREARRQAMGRVLNEEAAQREAAATAARSPSTLPYSLSTARRVRLWGRTDPNVELVQYAEAWARKIESNTPVDTVREVTKRPHTDPMLTVAIRSDGSVESVTFVLSSGVAEVDEAIRHIVQSHGPYRVFPPGLAREVDVIEVRRTWHFDVAIRLY